MSEQEAVILIQQAYPDVCLGDSIQSPGGEWLVWEANGEAIYSIDSSGCVEEYARTGRI